MQVHGGFHIEMQSNKTMYRAEEYTGIRTGYYESAAVKLLLPGSILQRENCMTKSFICMMRITDQFLSDLKPHLTLCLPFSCYGMLEAKTCFCHFRLSPCLALWMPRDSIHPISQSNLQTETAQGKMGMVTDFSLLRGTGEKHE